MNKIITIACLFLLIFFLESCQKAADFMGFASITGADVRTEPCTGGLYIKIDGHPNPNDPFYGYYDIGAKPASFYIDGLRRFPIRVKLNWKVSSKCFGNYVDITKLEFVQ